MKEGYFLRMRIFWLPAMGRKGLCLIYDWRETVAYSHEIQCYKFNYSAISLTPVVPKIKAAVHILKMYVKKN